MKYSYIVLCIVIIVGCQQEMPQKDEAPSKLELIASPAEGLSSLTPNLVKHINSPRVILSWLEQQDSTTYALKNASLNNRKLTWKSTRTIATGDNWFVNWADFPSVSIYESGKGIAAHWLQKRAEGTYDYDVMVMPYVSSQPKPRVLHTDGIAAEHGFVTLLPNGGNETFAVWLDGRNTKGDGQDSHEAQDDHGHGHGGAMTLRTATFDMDGQLFHEAELDNKVCDCCQTDAARINSNYMEEFIVVYRDRSDEEVRDIYYTRKVDSIWTEPKPVHQDNWKIEGCPVNGPAVAADYDKIMVAWYTAAEDKPMVKVAFSNDMGETFNTPIVVDEATPLGRVDVMFYNRKKAVVSWMQQQDEKAVLKLAFFNLKTQQLESVRTVAEMSPARQSGFPRMVEVEDVGILITWTEVLKEGGTEIKTGIWRM